MSELPPQTQTETPNPADNFEDIRDLVEVGDDNNGDGVNTLHRPDESGKLLSVDELEMIREYQDLIRGKEESDEAEEPEKVPGEDFEMDEQRAEKIAHYIHKHSKGKGTSPDVVEELYKRLEDEGDDFLDDDPDNPDFPDEPLDPDAPTEVMDIPNPGHRFTPEEIQKQQKILADIDEADRTFDRHQRMIKLHALAEKHKGTAFGGENGDLGVEAAQRIRVSKTRSKFNPRRLWVKKGKKSDVILDRMARERKMAYSLEAATAMGRSFYFKDKAERNVYKGRNKAIHQTNKWFETEGVPNTEKDIEYNNKKLVDVSEKLEKLQVELAQNPEDSDLLKRQEKYQKAMVGHIEKIRELSQYLEKRDNGIAALESMRGFRGHDYYGKGIAFLSIVRNDPALLESLSGLHFIRKEKAKVMMIPEKLKAGEIDLEEARRQANSVKQFDWRDEALKRINKIADTPAAS